MGKSLEAQRIPAFGFGMSMRPGFGAAQNQGGGLVPNGAILLNGQPVKLNGQFITLIPSTAILFNAQPVLLNGQFIAKAA